MNAENNGRDNLFRGYTLEGLEEFARNQYSMVTAAAALAGDYWLLDECVRALADTMGLMPSEGRDYVTQAFGFNGETLELARSIRDRDDEMDALSGMTPAEAAGSSPECESRGDGRNTNGNGKQRYEPKPKTMKVKGLRLLSDVTVKPVEWFWGGYLALGELHILEGDPDNNKTSLTYDIAARVTTGRPMPNTPTAAPLTGGALFLVGEDSIPKTVVGRLKAAGADLSRVAVLDDVSIPEDMSTIRKAVRLIGARLIVVDTLPDFVNCNVLGNQQIRRALRPLRKLAEKCNVAVVLLRHFVKSSSGRSLLRGGGSVGITAMARSQLKLFRHPDDEHLRVLVHDKCNIAPRSPSLVFEVVQGSGGKSFHLECKGETSLTVEDLEQKHKGSPTLDAAEQFLLDNLADGRKEVNWLLEQARGLCSKRTLDEAKRSLKIKTVREGKGHNHKVYWSL